LTLLLLALLHEDAENVEEEVHLEIQGGGGEVEGRGRGRGGGREKERVTTAINSLCGGGERKRTMHKEELSVLSFFVCDYFLRGFV
jgi:hypothetical protein